jgi:hypothetical protein
MGVGTVIREAALVLVIIIGIAFVVTTCVDEANSTEPTTLEAVLERDSHNVSVHKYVDKLNGVVCYWRGISDRLFCLHVTGNRTGVR